MICRKKSLKVVPMKRLQERERNLQSLSIHKFEVDFIHSGLSAEGALKSLCLDRMRHCICESKYKTSWGLVRGGDQWGQKDFRLAEEMVPPGRSQTPGKNIS
jgi:hypothetical protein